MYAYIKGILTEEDEGGCVVENNGIGYYLRCASPLTGRGYTIGDEIKAYTYLSIRDDAHELFGFTSKDELNMFKLLITVSGIGPKGAMGILGSMDSDELKFAIISGDEKAISSAPGIGKKTAQRVVLELKDKFDADDLLHAGGEDIGEDARLGGSAGGGFTETDARGETILALTALGYARSEVMNALNRVDITPDDDAESLLKKTLKEM